MALPELTDEQRRANLERAKRSRHERAALKASLKEGSIGVADVLADTRQCAQRMRVYDLLRSLPGYGKVKAGELMESLHIAESLARQGPGSPPARGAARRARQVGGVSRGGAVGL